jgi:hypothetical protein
VGDCPGFANFDGVMFWQLTGSNTLHRPLSTAWPGR